MRLADLVVVDLATLNAAPQIATWFADRGARVVKVEPPGGDPLRRLVDADGVALQWKLANRNKRSVACDVATADGRAQLDALLAGADLLVTSLSPARLRAWRLDADTLRAAHPRLVAVNLTTFGVDGPWAERPGSGTLAEAATGLAHLTGSPDGPPTLAPVGLGDHLGALQGLVAALAGLLARDADGGSFHDVAMTDALLGLMGQRLALVARTGHDPGRQDNRFPTMAARGAWRARDGRWVAITAGTDDMVRRLFTTMGCPELAEDPRFATNGARLAHADLLHAIVATWVAARPAADVVDDLLAARVSAATIDDLPTVLANPHFRARGCFAAADDAEAGRLETATAVPGTVVRWWGTLPDAG
jgi:crotonobetainyl-CoA:carnitine CoA-transferase CaiB-like acyl-CoA transferase